MRQRDSAPASGEQRLTVVYRKTATLRPYEQNARTHSPGQIAQIRASIREFGFNNPILLREDLTIGAGHGRWEAAGLEGLDEVPTIILPGLSDAQWRAYVIADNQLTLNGGWDGEILRREIEALTSAGFDLDLLGFADDELAQLLASGDAVRTGAIDDDDVPERDPDETTCRIGDVWNLGRHRLLVGDATDPACIDRLMGEDLGDLAWTDPPYNVAVSGKAGTILNDDMDGAAFETFITAAFTTLALALRPGAVAYVAHSETERATFTRAFTGAGFKLSQVRIWVKQSATLSRQDFNWQHEPILYGWKEGARHYFAGDFTKTTVLDDDIDLDGLKKDELRALLKELRAAIRSTVVRQDRPTRSDLHPTMKPVALVQEMIEASSREGDILVDVFAGSGSTLIAGEKTARTCRLMELDLHYADVIIARWEAFTGRSATLDGGERTFEEVTRERQGQAAAAA